MTKDEIIRFAIQCRLVTTGNRDGLYMDALTEFAKLVAAKEREACAKLCDKYNNDPLVFVSVEIAKEIRARGEQA